ncbi:hypothetical protein F5B22DRAFT_401756 [Xylaria bambusicola]|uniref:uncharacterized protein n=1 Tax=Xylaria bambusicola TaxID=326684 RepID=UPI00200753D9|nr:uncharacterized protein F5B22DRAFT_401756 [Xylaria bambusicola]KAI0508351.1 hypothetical protein F5B22DRAFT_401756 [Xylaria bambusicola]
MKASTIFVSALAAVASAAPTTTTPEKRTSIDLGAFNQFGFVNQDLQYLNALNLFDFQAFAQLASFNNLNIGGFQNIFNNNVFDINALLQLQQIALLSQLGGLGVFSNFDLSTLQLGGLNLGLVSGIGGFDVGSLIDASLVPQIQAIIQQAQFSTVII